MRTDEERIMLLHARANYLKRQRDKTVLTILGGLSAGLLACVLTVTLHLSTAAHSFVGDSMAGASILGQSVGGYVLVAVLSFSLAVIITVLCIQKSRKYRGEQEHQPEAKDADKHFP